MTPDIEVPSRLLTVVIVDDEPLARDCMRLALATQSDVQIVAECGDGAQAVAVIREHEPDVVLLDVQMPAMDGFQVIEQLEGGRMPAVVFVTAYDVHAVRAFEVHALDYVLKPFDDARLLAALERARRTVREQRQGEIARRLTDLLRAWMGAAHETVEGTMQDPHLVAPTPVMAGRSYVTRLTVRKDDRVRFIAIGDIHWIEADGNYLLLHVGDQRHRIRETLGQLTEQLDPRLFVRVHRSATVNVSYIREVQPWFGGDYIAIMRTGAQVRVSRHRAAQLLRPMV